MPKILVVEDEKHIVRLMTVYLERARHTVIPAYDGVEALEKIDSEKPDLVFLDWMMPYMNGIEVLKKIRANDTSTQLPVVMLSAKTTDRDIFEAYHYGVDVYLAKPFNPAELAGWVAKVLRL